MINLFIYVGNVSHILVMLVLSNSATPWTVACQASLSMGILQARILELVGMPSSRGSSQPRDQTQVSFLQADSLPSEPPRKYLLFMKVLILQMLLFCEILIYII